MALKAKHNNTEFGVGDVVKITQSYKQGGKLRKSVFEGIVIGIKGRGLGKSFTVRRIGVQHVGIEKIFPLGTPTIDSIRVVKKGIKGVRRSKLYYIREQSKREIDLIYSRAAKRTAAKSKKPKTNAAKKI